MENQTNVGNQNRQQIGQNPINQPVGNLGMNQSSSAIWQTDAFIILALIIFWPIGLFLMWRYVSWRKWVKTTLTLFFSATIVVPIILFFFSAVLFSNQIQKRSSFGTPPPSTDTNTQFQVQSKVYNFENLGNGYIRVTTQKYKATFEFSSNLKYYPPFGEEQPSVLESIGFQTEKRQKNDNSASFFINFSPSTTGTPCESYKSLPNWSITTLNELPAVKSTSTTSPTIIACNGIYNYAFSYSGAYTPNKEGALTSEDIAKEKEAYDHILQTFKVLP